MTAVSKNLKQMSTQSNWDRFDFSRGLDSAQSNVQRVYNKTSALDAIDAHKELLVTRMQSEFSSKLGHLPEREQRKKLKSMIRTSSLTAQASRARPLEEKQADAMNQQQKVHYLFNKARKWAKTSTINLQKDAPEEPGEAPRYMSNSQSKIIWSEKDRKPSTINSQPMKYDILSHIPNRKHGS